jgi:hypothetical protein
VNMMWQMFSHPDTVLKKLPSLLALFLYHFFKFFLFIASWIIYIPLPL